MCCFDDLVTSMAVYVMRFVAVFENCLDKSTLSGPSYNWSCLLMGHNSIAI